MFFHYHVSCLPASWVAKKIINLIHIQQLAWHASLPRGEHWIQSSKSSWHSRRPHFAFISIQQCLHIMAASMDWLFSLLLLLSPHHSNMKRSSLCQPGEFLHPVYFLDYFVEVSLSAYSQSFLFRPAKYSAAWINLPLLQWVLIPCLKESYSSTSKVVKCVSNHQRWMVTSGLKF